VIPLLIAQAAPPSWEQLVTLGGTAGLIAFLVYVVVQFGSSRWHGHADLQAADQRTVEANARTERALSAGEQSTASVRELTVELHAYRTLVERLLQERDAGTAK